MLVNNILSKLTSDICS